MKLSSEIIACIDKTVLCWLATVSKEHVPNVSPKEVFCQFDETRIIVANIASQQTVQHIKSNSKVCLSFIDIFIQKGYQIKGDAVIIDKTFPEFVEMHKKLSIMTNDKFPITKVISISVQSAKKIWAPSYQFFPDTTEKEQIEAAKKSYGI